MSTTLSQNALTSKARREGTDDDARAKRRKMEEEKQRESEQVEMKKLENLLFGSLYNPVSFGEKGGDLEGSDDGSALFHVDRSAPRQTPDYEDDDDDEEQSDDERVQSDDDDDEEVSEDERVVSEVVKKGEAAWEDEEEKEMSIDIATVNRLRKLRKEENEGLISGSEYISRLRAHHAKLNPGTEWARTDSQIIDGDSSDEDDDDVLRTNEDLVVKSGGSKLCSGLLEYTQLADANIADPSNAPINSVQFHQNAQLLLTAGLDRRLRFFQIDGKRNTKIQSIFLEDCPITKAAFLPNGSQVIVSGRRKYFYSFDLEHAKFDKIGPLVGREEKSLERFEVSQDSKTIAFIGNEGYILLVSTKTKELTGTLKMNGSVRSLAFSDDGKQLLSSGGDGQVYVWDLRTMKCLYKGVDEGSTCGTSLCSSPSGALFASGTDRGIVNIYKKAEFLGGKRKPIKTVENLTSMIDFMKFNHDGQILAIISKMNKNSVKLVHVPSLTVFSNWPPPKKTMDHPCCLDFSPGSGFMAMGNAKGKVLLYKLNHYMNA
ncbi:U3 small nucleolar RNA-associated protein 18 [Hirschfeldia incana]|nr:U3 small nucleolar RNA-associated protein 18 [Hirschfeldia incana]KAJ0243473.1 U3 small nucleolar RNA-associated protein 18 [Hirschfeldia incana]